MVGWQVVLEADHHEEDIQVRRWQWQPGIRCQHECNEECSHAEVAATMGNYFHSFFLFTKISKPFEWKF